MLLEEAELQIHYSGQHFWAAPLVTLLAGESCLLASLLTVFLAVKVCRAPFAGPKTKHPKP